MASETIISRNFQLKNSDNIETWNRSCSFVVHYHLFAMYALKAFFQHPLTLDVLLCVISQVDFCLQTKMSGFQILSRHTCKISSPFPKISTVAVVQSLRRWNKSKKHPRHSFCENIKRLSYIWERKKPHLTDTHISCEGTFGVKIWKKLQNHLVLYNLHNICLCTYFFSLGCSLLIAQIWLNNICMFFGPKTRM